MLSSCPHFFLIIGAGKDFDFTQQTIPDIDKPARLHAEPGSEQVAAARQIHQTLPKQQSPLQPQPTFAGSAGTPCQSYTRSSLLGPRIDHRYL